MSDPVSEVQAPAAVQAGETAAISRSSATDQPISLWPEGVLALAAGITLLVICLRHRTYIQRKAQELQRVVDEFQRQGGVEDLTHVARQAADFIKGAGSA